MSLICAIMFTTPLIVPSTSAYGRKCDKLIKTTRRFKIKKHTQRYGYCQRKGNDDSKHPSNSQSSDSHVSGYSCENMITLRYTNIRMSYSVKKSPNSCGELNGLKAECECVRASTQESVANTVKFSVNTTTQSRQSANKNPHHSKVPFDLSLIYGWLVLCLLTQLNIAQNTGRCYFFKSGTTIAGSEYRRDYDMGQKTCSEVCKYDACCMAYEYQSEEEICTLKTRSINGTVVTKPNTAFGLCLDYADTERDRLWDHVVHGDTVASFPQVPKEKCLDLCRRLNQQSLPTVKKSTNPIKRISDKRQRKIFRQNFAEEMQKTSLAIMYSWRIDNERDIDLSDGTCKCISVLRSISVSFGSFSGFLL